MVCHTSSSSAAIHTAHNEPNEDPPWTEESDDTVQNMVGALVSHICGRMGLGTHREQKGLKVTLNTRSIKTQLGGGGGKLHKPTVVVSYKIVKSKEVRPYDNFPPPLSLSRYSHHIGQF